MFIKKLNQQPSDGLSAKTIKQYRGLANRFYLGLDGDFSPSSMAAHLQKLARIYKPDVWRKLRCAIAYDQKEKGYIEPAKQIKKQKYPSTILPSDLPSKVAKVKRVKEEEFKKLYNATTNKKLRAALIVAKLTGCRPAEMLHIKERGDNKFFIPSAKKTEDGLRGLDRIIQLNDKDDLSLSIALDQLSKLDPNKGKVSLQKALERATKKTWPKRKKHITFYSFRHQMASNLKSAGIDLKTRSYIMGHQSTTSIDKYGDKRSGTGACGTSAGVSYEKIESKVREAEKPDFDKINTMRAKAHHLSN